MTEKIYIVTDLGPGDGGKGSIVHWIANKMQVHTVIKRGGAQGSHGVSNSHGERFNFSQWGCGTLEGIPTYLSDQMVIMPVGLLNEADALKMQCGINNAFDLLEVDPSCICATPYHKISSQIKELARGKNPRGTIGTGVGEAYRYAKTHPELTILAGDLWVSQREKLAAVREQIEHDLEPLVHDMQSRFSADDRMMANANLEMLKSDGFLDYICGVFHEVGQKIRFAYLDEILRRNGSAVVECSHGVLTDAECGFAPHTSAIRTLPKFTRSMLDSAGFTGKFVNLGVHRAYAIRHGAGPLPTADPAMNEVLLPGSHKEANRWQGEVRVGALDIPLINHAIESCGWTEVFNGLCLTWFDQVVKNGEWKICTGYKSPVDFTTEGLALADPVYEVHEVPTGYTREELFGWCSDILGKYVSVPVRMVSFGATELDKIII